MLVGFYMARITCSSIVINRSSSARGNARKLQWCTNRSILNLTPSQQSILKPLSRVQSRIFYTFLQFFIYLVPKSTFYIHAYLDRTAHLETVSSEGWTRNLICCLNTERRKSDKGIIKGKRKVIKYMKSKDTNEFQRNFPLVKKNISYNMDLWVKWPKNGRIKETDTSPSKDISRIRVSLGEWTYATVLVRQMLYT
jgi:hypothetical protein